MLKSFFSKLTGGLGINSTGIDIEGVLDKPEDLAQKILNFSKSFQSSVCRFFERETVSLEDVANTADLIELLTLMDGVKFRFRIQYGHFNYIWITLYGGTSRNRAVEVRLSWNLGDSTEGEGPTQALPALLNNAKRVLYARRRTKV